MDFTSLGFRTLRLAMTVHSYRVKALEDDTGILSNLAQAKVHSEALPVKNASIWCRVVIYYHLHYN